MQALEDRNAAALAALTTTPAVMRFLQDRAEKTSTREGLRDVKAVDLSSLARQARAGSRRQYGPAPYNPEPGCKALLRLREAVHVTWWHDSYADMAVYAVPVDILAGADLDVCRRNLSRFASALRTHTGLAGSGCTYEAALVQNEAGALVVLTQRASIPD